MLPSTRAGAAMRADANRPPVSPALQRAEHRLLAALDRIETALDARGTASADHARADQERDALARDCELLRVECDGLRRELARSEARRERLVTTSAAVGHRLDAVIGELDELADD